MKRCHVFALGTILGVFAASSCDCGLEPLQELPDPPVQEQPDPEPEPEPAPTGNIEGRICRPDGSTWLAGADAVVVAADGTRVDGVTDDDGRFRLEGVPAGAQRVHITLDDIEVVKDAVVPADDTVVIPDDACEILPPGLRIAVVHGSNYDRVEGVLEELGVDLETLDVYQSDWAQQLLSTDDGLDDYDILFLNCRSEESVYMANPAMQERLREFVNRGGALYAADQAYDIIEVAFPEEINFFGDDDVRGAGDQGNTVDVSARIDDATLAARMGGPTVGLHFGLTTWSVMISAADDTDVYIRADVPLLDGSTIADAPMTVGFHHGSGHVVYSSFHEEPGIGQGQEQVLKLIMFEL